MHPFYSSSLASTCSLTMPPLTTHTLLHSSSSFYRPTPFFVTKTSSPISPAFSRRCTFAPSTPAVYLPERRAIQPQEISVERWKFANPRSPENVCDLSPINLLERAATVYSDCSAIRYNGTCRTWSETYVRCLKLASSIVSLGIKRGDVVSVVAPNVPAMVELHFSVPMSGAILNTINLRLDAASIFGILQHGESRIVFVDSKSLAVVRRAISLFPGNVARPNLVLINEDDDVGDAENGDCENVNGNDEPIHDDYESLVEKGDPGFKWIRPNSEWDPITLSYTSGTTSSPKGVVHSHRGAMMLCLDSLLYWSVPQRPVYLWTLPMFHVNGWGYSWGMAAVGGVNVCLRHINSTAIYRAIERHKVTHMCGAPIVLNMLINHLGKNQLKSPVHIMTAGAPPPAPVLARAESLGFIVTHGYGLTEVGGLVVTCAWKQEWDELPAAERSVLKARQGVRSMLLAEMDVVDTDSGSSVPRDGSTFGEVVLRGASLMLGYLKAPEETRKCITADGWFHTGDVGVVHPDGYLEIKDRAKDIIICGGENLSSVEIEAALYAHPGVNEAAVVGQPSKFWGETPCAFVSLKMGRGATEKELREFCKERLPLYLVPRTVVVLDDLPKTPTGKIQKFLLRNIARQL